MSPTLDLPPLAVRENQSPPQFRTQFSVLGGGGDRGQSPPQPLSLTLAQESDEEIFSSLYPKLIVRRGGSSPQSIV